MGESPPLSPELIRELKLRTQSRPRLDDQQVWELSSQFCEGWYPDNE